MHAAFFPEQRKRDKKILWNSTDLIFTPCHGRGKNAGHTMPTPIQVQAIPAFLEGRDVMGLAQTGLEKTAAFVLPVLNQLIEGARRQVRTLVIAPTRELAEQIHHYRHSWKNNPAPKRSGIWRCRTRAADRKITGRRGNCNSLPGRLLDHIGQGRIDLSHLEILILDEADRMNV
jgi:ATP-dependent RNA helicase RhlE